jgi:hypothetical protein
VEDVSDILPKISDFLKHYSSENSVPIQLDQEPDSVPKVNN